jgi:iron complex outermembrane recepter protein
LSSPTPLWRSNAGDQLTVPSAAAATLSVVLEENRNWLIFKSNGVTLVLAHADGRYDSNADGRVDSDLGGANIAPDRVNVSWDRTWSELASSRLQVNHLLNRDFEDSTGSTTAEFDGYTTVDLTTDISVFDGVLSAAIQNLTNEDYFTYYSQTSQLDVRYFKETRADVPGGVSKVVLMWKMRSVGTPPP